MGYIDQVMKNGELVDIHDKRIDNIENLGGGGSSSSTPTSSFDYIQMSFNSNDSIILMFDKKITREDTSVPTGVNQLLTQLNTMGSLSIPAYTDLEDLVDIAEYLNALDTQTYAQIKVVFWASVFSLYPYLCLSAKGYTNGTVVPILITGTADANNNNFSYSVKYIDDSGTVNTIASSQTVFDFAIHVNDLD